MRAFMKGFLGTPWIQFIHEILTGLDEDGLFVSGGKRYRHTVVNVRAEGNP